MSHDFWLGWASAMLTVLLAVGGVDLWVYLYAKVTKRRVTLTVATTHGTRREES